MIRNKVNDEEWMVWNRAIGKARKAFFFGINCFKKGQVDNPYKEGSFFYKEWQRGFDKAYFENVMKCT